MVEDSGGEELVGDHEDVEVLACEEEDMELVTK